ncbi:MAG: class I SAM-dependent methyltransferase, partial [Candidatus Nanoarchaeia archaeon]
KKNKLRNITVFESGTSRGFSSLCMAKAIDDEKIQGKIITTDILPVHQRIYWNSISDIKPEKGKKNRKELLKKWENLIENYIVFVQSYSDLAMEQIFVPRINFAFIDGEHTYAAVKKELSWISNFQKRGDQMVLDDYTKSQFPGIVRAVDEFCETQKNYNKTIIKTGKTQREYVLLTRK